MPHGPGQYAVISDCSGETVLPADRFGDGTGGSVDADQALRGSIRAALLRGRPIVSEAEPVSIEPNRTYPASVISR